MISILSLVRTGCADGGRGVYLPLKQYFDFYRCSHHLP